MSAPRHSQDFHAWALHNATLLRQSRLDALDLENIAEALEDMGSSRECELENRLGVLLAQLLQWAYQPEGHCNKWRAHIMEQRRRLTRLLRRNPSLNSHLDETLAEAYGDARLIAMRETGLDCVAFPVVCPFSVQHALDDSFWPLA